MAQAQKFRQVASVIERQINRGDYLLRPVPGERRIAEETGVSRMTARKAVRELLDRNVLVRQLNGALGISPGYHADAGAAQLLLLYPAFPSSYLTQLCKNVTKVAQDHKLTVRPVQYVHWDDPIVLKAVSNPGGVIVIPSSFDVPAHILPLIQSNRVISLDLDLSDRGVPSMRLFPDAHICKVFSHLEKLGHTRIDCISAHAHNPEIQRRIQLWREWSYRHGITGELWESAAPSFKDPTPYAYEEMTRLFRGGLVKSTAFVGTTFPAAVGAIRACWEQGLMVGKDISVCAMNIEQPAQFMTPSVTGLDSPDLSAMLRRCFDSFTSDQQWVSPLRLEPAEPRFFAGESTGVRPLGAGFNCLPSIATV